MNHTGHILILDFGSQYTQLIARRVREQNVYCEIHPFNFSIEKILENPPKGIILSGGPTSVYSENAPHSDEKFSRSEFRFLAFATACNLFRNNLVAKL